jgi:hypothetical protein
MIFKAYLECDKIIPVDITVLLQIICDASIKG